MLLFTDILIGALLRATFAQALRWRSPGEGFTVQSSLATDRIEDAFRFDDEGAWLGFEATATGSSHEMPHIRLRVTVPAADVDGETGLRMANDVNRRGLASVHFDAPAGALVVQQTLVFTGYHDVNPLDIDAGITFAQREATLNMLVAVISSCESCLRQLHPREVLPSPHVRRVKTPSVEALELFTTFVLTRLYRWDCVRLAGGGAALELVRQAAIRSMTEDTLVQEQEADPCLRPDRQAARESARLHIDRWVQERIERARTDDMQFDGILYTVDRHLRWSLREVMADPPRTRPARQLVLLEQALAAHRTAWESVQVIQRDLGAALALGLDIEVAEVPQKVVQRLLERFPFLAPAPDALSYALPEHHWLTGYRRG